MKTIMLTILLTLFSGQALADDMRPASLTVTALDSSSFSVVWKVPAKGDKRLKLDVVFDAGLQPVGAKQQMLLAGAYVEKWTVARAGGVNGLDIQVEGLKYNPADVLVRVIDQHNETITTVINTDQQRYLTPQKIETGNVALTYSVLGVEHILIGLDHLLFVACLIYIARTGRKIMLTISGFTAAHSLSLMLAATDTLTIAIPPVEAAIALSIVFLAMEIAKNRSHSLTLRYPVLVSTSFGLLHGFGFASVLADIGLPAQEKILALLAFNVGVEVGQLLFVAALVLLLRLLQALHQRITAEALRPLVSYGCGSVAMFWLLQRLLAF